MMRYVILWVGLGVFGLFSGLVALSQDTQKRGQKGVEVVPNAPSVSQAVVQDGGGCFLLICDSDPKLVIVLDGSGKWLDNVRSVRFSSDFASCDVSCTMWSGLLKPSSPKSVSWTVQQVKSISRDEFTRVLDELQVNPVYKQ